MCGIHCLGHHYQIHSSSRPPKNGWALRELPAEFDAQVRAVWSGKKRGAASAEDAEVKALTFLHHNGVERTDLVQNAIREALDDQYCGDEPHRCAKRPKKKVAAEETQPEGSQPRMPWARPFWEAWNYLAGIQLTEPALVADAKADEAETILLSPGLGCPHCLQHFRVLREACPTERIQTNDDHRVWLWAAHAESKEGYPEIPFNTIARKFGWPEISDDTLIDTLDRLGFSSL